MDRFWGKVIQDDSDVTILQDYSGSNSISLKDQQKDKADYLVLSEL